jgi:Ca2+-binding RTX toxin-like protein
MNLGTVQPVPDSLPYNPPLLASYLRQTKPTGVEVGCAVGRSPVPNCPKEARKMVKVVFESNNINDIFNGTAELKISGNRQRATYADGLTEGKLVFLGSNFVRDGETPYLSGGKIHTLRITDENDDFAFKLTGADINAKNLPHSYTTGDLTGLLTVMLSGKDRMIGSDDGDYLSGYGKTDWINGKTGDDFITGGRGNDILTGGPGTDTFHFVPTEDGKSHDRIIDFDIEGPIVDHLFIEPIDPLSIKAVDAIHKGHDTLLTLSGGSTILLDNIRKADLMDYFAEV